MKNTISATLCAVLLFLGGTSRADQQWLTNQRAQGFQLDGLHDPAASKDPATAAFRLGDFPQLGTPCILQANGSNAKPTCSSLTGFTAHAPLLLTGPDLTLTLDGTSIGMSGGGLQRLALVFSGAVTGTMAAGSGSLTTAFGTQAGLSLFGVAGSSTAVPAPIVASADNQVFQRLGGAVQAHTLDFSQLTGTPPAVTSMTGAVVGTGPGATATTFGTQTGNSFFGVAGGSTAVPAPISCATPGTFAGNVGGTLACTSTIPATSAPLAAGAIGFGSAGNLLTGDATNFHWDGTNFRIGLRISAPAYEADFVDQAGAADRGLALRTFVNGAAGPRLATFAYQGTLASPTAVDTTKYLGSYEFNAFDGTNPIRVAEMVGHVTNGATVAAGSVPSEIGFAASATGVSDPYGSNGTLALRILSNGRIGVGYLPNDTIPSLFSVKASSTDTFRVAAASTSFIGANTSFTLSDVASVSNETFAIGNSPGNGRGLRYIEGSRYLNLGAYGSYSGNPIPTDGSAVFALTSSSAGSTATVGINSANPAGFAAVLFENDRGWNDNTGTAAYYITGSAWGGGEGVDQFVSGTSSHGTLFFDRVAGAKVARISSAQGVLLYDNTASVSLSGSSALRSSSGSLQYSENGGAWKAFDSLASLADPGGNGIVVRTALNTTAARTLTNTDGTITFTNPDGVAANPVINTTGLTPSTRTATGTAPVAIDGDHAAHDLSANRTWSLDANGVTNTLLRQSGALSVVGRSANSTGNVADIQATAASGAVLRESGSTVGFGTIATAGIANNAVTYGKVQQGAALSVLGVPGTSTANLADIAASGGSQCLQTNSGGTAVLWAACPSPGGGGTVTNVSGTSGQVNVVNNTTTPVISLPNVGPGATTTGTAGIQSITTDAQGRVVSAATATYLTSSGTTPGTYNNLTVAASGLITGASVTSWMTSGAIMKSAGLAALPVAAVAGTDYSAGTASNSTGLVKSTTGTGALSTAVAGTDYQAPITGTAGSVMFIGGGGTPTQDNAAFFWKDSETKLGIGTNTLAAAGGSGFGATDQKPHLYLYDATAGAFTSMVLMGGSVAGGSGGSAIQFMDTSGTPTGDFGQTLGSSGGVFFVNRISTGSLFFDTAGGAGLGARMTITPPGSVQIGGSALATSATDGFLYIPSMAGVPSGAPTTLSATVPLVLDSTHGRLYVPNGASPSPIGQSTVAFATGLLKNTTATGVWSIASASDVSTALGTGASTGILEATSGAYGTVTVGPGVTYNTTTLRLGSVGSPIGPSVAEFGDAPPSVASASNRQAAYQWDAVNIVLTGSTHLTGNGLGLMNLQAPTITDASAVTVDTAATLAISGAPVAGGSVTLTNPYALWVQGGNVRMDGNLFLPNYGGGLGGMLTSTPGGAVINSGLASVSIDYFTSVSGPSIAGTTTQWLIHSNTGVTPNHAVEQPHAVILTHGNLCINLNTNTITSGTITVAVTMNGSPIASIPVNSSTGIGVVCSGSFATGSSSSNDTYGVSVVGSPATAVSSPNMEWSTDLQLSRYSF